MYVSLGEKLKDSHVPDMSAPEPDPGDRGAV